MKKKIIKAWKGGRTDRIYSRIHPYAKERLLDRIKLEGHATLGDWLESESRKKPRRCRNHTPATITDGENSILFCEECGIIIEKD